MLIWLWRKGRDRPYRTADPHWQAILGKYESLVGPLVLLCHLGTDNWKRQQVGEDSLEKALNWTVYLMGHARRIYHCVHDPDRGAKNLAGNLHRLPSPFTASDFRDKGWSGLTTAQQRGLALDTLRDRNYLQPERAETKGRPVIRYHINPEALKE
jgi:hypothetical protein